MNNQKYRTYAPVVKNRGFYENTSLEHRKFAKNPVSLAEYASIEIPILKFDRS